MKLFFLIRYRLVIVGLLLVGISCEKNLEKAILKPDSNKFIANVLNLEGIPSTPQDRSVSSFCDLGAWHSFALPSADSTHYFGGFIGPFSMDRDNGIWLGKAFAQVSLYDQNRRKIKFTSTVLNQYPGYLEQNLTTETQGLKVNIKLWFQSNSSVIVTAKIINTTTKPMTLLAGWSGDVWLENASFNIEKQLQVTFSDSKSIYKYTFDRDFNTKIDDSNKSFTKVTKTPIKIAPNTSEHISLMYAFYFNEKDTKQTDIALTNANVNKSYNKTLDRWQFYHDAFPYKEIHGLDSLGFEILKSKAIQTLITNWKSAAGELKYDGLFPSYLYKGFHGFWAWDSWKHAVALARFEPQLAKQQMLTMFAYQNEEGMVPDCIFRDNLIEKHNWRDTKPPLATWAVNEIFEKTKDTGFVTEMFPKLIKYHYWWYKNRDHDGNKLCEYGSTDGTRIAAAWESGMDNAVRFDNSLILNNKDGAWSLNQESVDLNSYLVVEKQLLSKLAKIANNYSYIDQLQSEAKEVSSLINTQFYDNDEHYYFDQQLINHKKIKVFGPEGWLPLWAEIATPKMAEGVKERILDTSIFNSKVPFPTLDISYKDFDPENGYWRGPVWLDQAYFAIVGLEKYGYAKEANMLKLKLVKNAEGLLEKGYPIRENYHPISGKGLNANHFSWSAAHLLLLIE